MCYVEYHLFAVVEEETKKDKKAKKDEGKEAEDEAMKIPMHKRNMNTFIPSLWTYPRSLQTENDINTMLRTLTHQYGVF